MSIELCAAQVSRSDPWRFRTAMTAPLPGRGALMVLYAFNLEVARAPWVTTEPTLAEMRLQWWRDAIAEIFSEAEPRRHEVVTPLAALIRAQALPRGPFEAMIDARRYEIYSDGPRDLASAWRFVAESAGALMELSARALGAAEAEAEVAARAGLGQGAAALLAARPALEAAGRPPLDGGAAIRVDFAQGGIDHLAKARATQVPRAVLPALRPALGAEAVLAQIIAKPDQPPARWSPARERLALMAAALRGRW